MSDYRITNNQDDWMSHALKLEAENEHLRAEIASLRAALQEMIKISQRNSDAQLMLIAIRKCARHALKEKT